jgi:hypothetical protein
VPRRPNPDRLEAIYQAVADNPGECPGFIACLLRLAWGIWWGEGEPVDVRLHFFPGATARRVRESIWHPSQQIDDLPDGGCEWSARVGEWREMFSWVRGRGADVEVLAPDERRRAMLDEVSRLQARYAAYS